MVAGQSRPRWRAAKGRPPLGDDADRGGARSAERLLQLIRNALGDRFGRKRWFLIGLTMFTAFSALASFSNSMEMLIAMRALQGLGAALIMPMSLSLISAAFPPEERGKALGIWSAVSVSSIALGPVIGGVIVEYFHWSWIFLINVPIGIAALLVSQAVIRESRDESGTVSTDIPGTVLITAGIASLTWGLIQAGERGWTDRWILAAFITAAVILPIFIWVELRTERPMIPLGFFRSRTFTGANIDAFMISFLITGVSFFLTLYMQNIHGFSPIRTGLSLLPMVAVMMVGLDYDRIRDGLRILDAQPRGEDRLLRMVDDYLPDNVSEKVVRILVSYTDYVNRQVWRRPG